MNRSKLCIANAKLSISPKLGGQCCYHSNRGADVNLSGFEGTTPIYLAALANQPGIVQLLVDTHAKLEMDENLNNGWGPLVVGYDFLEVVRILLQN